jgi:hypothetical protein
VHQSDDLCAHNELKLTYEHLQVKKFSGGKSPQSQDTKRGARGRGYFKEGRAKEGRGGGRGEGTGRGKRDGRGRGKGAVRGRGI